MHSWHWAKVYKLQKPIDMLQYIINKCTPKNLILAMKKRKHSPTVSNRAILYVTTRLHMIWLSQDGLWLWCISNLVYISFDVKVTPAPTWDDDTFFPICACSLKYLTYGTFIKSLFSSLRSLLFFTFPSDPWVILTGSLFFPVLWGLKSWHWRGEFHHLELNRCWRNISKPSLCFQG